MASAFWAVPDATAIAFRAVWVAVTEIGCESGRGDVRTNCTRQHEHVPLGGASIGSWPISAAWRSGRNVNERMTTYEASAPPDPSSKPPSLQQQQPSASRSPSPRPYHPDSVPNCARCPCQIPPAYPDYRTIPCERPGAGRRCWWLRWWHSCVSRSTFPSPTRLRASGWARRRGRWCC